jgi:hypothetical protein
MELMNKTARCNDEEILRGSMQDKKWEWKLMAELTSQVTYGTVIKT